MSGNDADQEWVPCLQAAAPSVLTKCVPAYKSQAVPAVKNSTQFYNVFITLPDCFYGLVGPSAIPLPQTP